ncbi:hypothetical protein CLV62_11088 [Dysgonomonas alginatilytica]|uniref:ABC-2 family transporter n=1 Tax=Dysgonomonas alginatilytica TaxID=1605892 RepID=A0A2V3PR42_9BACT|nr:hypothetical protein [Dysgonomonas alginatilytica]PXV64444.1 hypothetical protein CLV62_11088 [Dysgonomonas alginatilytica]
MNNTFDLKRFMYLEIYDFVKSKNQLLLIVASIVILYVLAVLFDSFENFNFFPNFIGLVPLSALAAIIISPCILVPKLDKYTGTFQYTLPVSNFERLLSFVLKYIVIIPLLCLSTVFVLKSISPLFVSEDRAILYNKVLDLEMNLNFLVFGFQAVFLLGYFYFRKLAIIKVPVTLFLFFILLQTVSMITVKYLMNTDISYSIFNLLQPSEFYIQWMDGSNSIISICNAILRLIIPFGIWVAIYFKLKETEI